MRCVAPNFKAISRAAVSAATGSLVGQELHGHVIAIAELAELAINIGIMDFPGARLMAAWHIGDVH